MIKKIVGLLFVVAMLFCTINVGLLSVHAEEMDEADLCFIDALDLMVDEEVRLLEYSRNDIYNQALAPIGYVYEMRLNGEVGYVLMINLAGYYEVTELYLRKKSPFNNIEGMPIYLTPLCYIEFIDGQFMDIENGKVLSEEELQILQEKGFGYKDDSYSSSEYNGVIVTDSITYDSRQVEKSSITCQLPTYFNGDPSYKNMCAVNAGSVVLGYYSRYYPVLTPGFVVGWEYSGYYLFWNDSTGAMQPIIKDLYVRMGTNANGAGTTATGFKNGLKSYVNSKGLNITYTSVASNNTLDYNSYKTQIANEKPVVLFFNTYNLAALPETVNGNNNSKTDKLELKSFSGMHVMVGYGYAKYTYYKNNSVFRTDYYVRAYTGALEEALGYIKLYDRSILVEGYAINIY